MSRSQSLWEPLQYVTAPYQAVGGSVPAPSYTTTESDVEALAALSRERPATARELRKAVAALHEAPHLASALDHILEHTQTLAAAEFANVQIADPRDGSLVLVAQSGFGPAFLEHFAVVHDERSVCGQAAGQGAQTVVADVQSDESLEPHWQVFRAAGVRAVQSTPLLDSTDRLIGVVSTHSPRPRQPSERDLHVMLLYSRFAGQTVARLLDQGDPA